MRLAIVVDSTAALTRGEATRLGVTMVGDTYVRAGQPCVETYMGENGDYAADLAAGAITETRTAGPEAFLAAFESLVASGYDVLCVTLSSRLGGTYRNACRAADAIPAESNPQGRRVAVIDSLAGFSCAEYLARRARQLEAAGADFSGVIDGVLQARSRQGICFAVMSLDSLRAAGRLSMVPQSVSTAINRYPVFTMVDGAIAVADTARGISTLARKMVAQVPADETDLTLAHYGGRGPLIVELFKSARAAFPQAKIRVKDGGPVLSCNLGLGAASIAWAPEEPAAGADRGLGDGCGAGRAAEDRR